MQYIKNKRSPIGCCNICGKTEKLTWDHVPPKSILIQPDVFVNTVMNGVPTEQEHMHHYQSGIKYRTICSKCNNTVLGQNDSSLKKFIVSINDALNNLIRNNPVGPYDGLSITVNTEINRVLRAICGHFLAMKTEYDSSTKPDLFMREYVLDTTAILSKGNLYCWFYPFQSVLCARDFVVKGYKVSSHPVGMVSVMATYPLGFLFASDREDLCNVDDLGKYSTRNINETVPVTLRIQTLTYPGTQVFKSFIWPLNISNGDNDAMFALGNNELMNGSRLGMAKRK